MEAMTKHHFQQEVQGFVILVQGTSKTLEASSCLKPFDDATQDRLENVMQFVQKPASIKINILSCG